MKRLVWLGAFVWVLGVIALLARSPVAGQSGVTATALGEAEFPRPPAPPVNIRVSEGMFPSSGPPIVHAHGAGWVYVVQGAHILVMGGRSLTFQPGQAVWTPAGVEHTHDWDRSQTHRFWFIGTATNQPPTLPPGFRLFRLTDPLEGLQNSAYRVRLSSVTLAPGALGTIVKVLDPEVLIGLSGTLSLVTGTGTQALRTEQVILMQPGSAYQLRNLAGSHASALVQSLMLKE